MSKPIQTIRIGLAGLGTVGGGVYQNLIRNRALLQGRLGINLDVVAISVRDPERDRGFDVDHGLFVNGWRELINNPEIDVVVELIGGTTEAKDLVLGALQAGKAVVTGNKALLAEHGADIFKVVEETGQPIYYEAAIAGGIPIIKTILESLVGNHIISACGIINGTCNYILTRMATEGLHYGEALREAMAKGYAEADPTLDINGMDAAHKAIIIASLAYGSWLPCDSMHVEGIESVDLIDLQFAEKLGYTVKLLSVIKGHEDGSIEVRTQPSLLPLDHILASVHGVFNAIAVHGDIVGETLFYGSGAGQDPTSSSVISDLADAAMAIAGSKPRSSFTPHGVYGKPVAIDDTLSRYYLRLQAEARPGVLARIAGVLAEHEIGIISVLQPDEPDGDDSLPAQLVVTLHEARYGDMIAARDKIAALDCVRAKPVLLRVETL